LSDNNNEAIDESTLVALSAIFAVDESWGVDLEKFQLLRNGELDVLLQGKYSEQMKQLRTVQLDDVIILLQGALEKHINTFGNAIFKNTEERQQFLHILAATKIN